MNNYVIVVNVPDDGTPPSLFDILNGNPIPTNKPMKVNPERK